MMRIKKYAILLSISAAMLVLVMGFLLVNRPNSPLFSAIIRCEDGEQSITCWENQEEQIYIFLPSGVELENVCLVKQTQETVMINGQPVADTIFCSTFSADMPYEITYSSFGKQKKKTLTFVQSENVPALFITTESGRNEYLHEDKNNKESGFMSLYSADGQLEYQGTADSVGGRGNYSWIYSDKKPYNVVLTEDANLLSLGRGSKWVLLANSVDATLMRNKIVFDFAKQLGLPYSPDSQWVDLYMNGEYRGLYLLSESADIGADRVNISPTDGVILAMEPESILQEKKDTYFVTDAGIALEVRSPKTVDQETISVLAMKLQSVENALLAEDGVDDLTEASWESLIDVDSWVKKYLVDEVFANYDAFWRSSYFYYSDNTERLFAGPVWDYDKSQGNDDAWQSKEPNTFWANRPAAVQEVQTSWMDNLYRKDEFYCRAVEMYQTTFLPELEHLLSETIYEYAEEISVAASADKIRWNDASGLMEHIDALRKYMENRVEFLNSIWLEERDYCVVRASTQWGGYYAYYVVFTGDTLTILPDFEDTETASFVGWYDEKTGEPFDAKQPITDDMEIYAKWVDCSSKRISQIIKLVPLAVIAVTGVLLVVSEFRRIKNNVGEKKCK